MSASIVLGKVLAVIFLSSGKLCLPGCTKRFSFGCALLVEDADVAELLEIDGCVLALGHVAFDEVLNAEAG